MTELDKYVFPGDRYTRSGIKSGHGQGMSLRDWLAGQALAGIMSNCDTSGGNGWNGIHNEAAKTAYMMADAMLEARK